MVLKESLVCLVCYLLRQSGDMNYVWPANCSLSEDL
jgi:hypothetical protein